MAHRDRPGPEGLQHLVDLRGEGRFVVLREAAVPQRPVLAGGEGRGRVLLRLCHVLVQLAVHPGVDRFAAERRHLGGEPTVDEGDAVDLREDGPLAQPPAVTALRREGRGALDEAERHLLHELRAEGVLVEGLPRGLRALARLGQGRLVVVLPPPRRLRLLEALVLLRVDVAEVPQHVHDLVVAEERVDAPAGLARLALEAHQEVEHLAPVRPPVEQVARLHEVGLSACPPVLRVHEAREAQDGDQVVVAAVDVAHRHHAGRVGDAAGVVGGRRRDGERHPDQEGSRGAEHPRPGRGGAALHALHLRTGRRRPRPSPGRASRSGPRSCRGA